MMFDRTDSPERRDADGHRHVDVAAGPHPVLGQMTDYLVERRRREAVELNLGYRHESADRHADRDTDEGGLRQRRVETSSVAERLGKPLGHPEHSAESGDVLA